jgi:hypothetical protein
VLQVTGTGKFHPITCHEGPDGEYRYTPVLSLTTALNGVGGQLHVPAALSLGMTRYPLCRRLVKLQDRSGRVGKCRPSGVLDVRTVHPVVSRYTACAVPASLARNVSLNFRIAPKLEFRLVRRAWGRSLCIGHGFDKLAHFGL